MARLPYKCIEQPRVGFAMGRRAPEQRGRRMTDAVSVTLIAKHFKSIVADWTDGQRRMLRAFVECSGNCEEAAFRAGTFRANVNDCAKKAMRTITAKAGAQ